MGEVAYKPAKPIKEIYPGGTLMPAKFMPSYYEWLAAKGEQVVLGTNATAATKTVYTVPADHTLFITSTWMSCRYSGAADNTGSLYYGYYEILQTITINGNSTMGVANSVSYPSPVKLLPGTILTMTSGIGMQTYTGFAGFLVKNSDIPSF